MSLNELSTDDIRAMPPGVEIRRLVAEAMGMVFNGAFWVRRETESACRSIASIDRSDGTFQPDLSHDDMAEVVAWWVAHNELPIKIVWNATEAKVKIEYLKTGRSHIYCPVDIAAAAPSLPLAVCRAVLLACREETK